MTHGLRKDTGHCGDKVIAQDQEAAVHILSAFRKSKVIDPLPLFVLHLLKVPQITLIGTSAREPSV